MKDNTKKTIEGFGKFFGASAYGFTHMPILVAREIKQENKRKKMRKGLLEWGKLIREMEASGKYTEEQLDNIVLWYTEAARQYTEML